jgi:hypothetical protein
MSLEHDAPSFVGPTAEEIAQNVDLKGKNILITGANSGFVLAFLPSCSAEHRLIGFVCS